MSSQVYPVLIIIFLPTHTISIPDIRPNAPKPFRPPLLKQAILNASRTAEQRLRRAVIEATIARTRGSGSAGGHGVIGSDVPVRDVEQAREDEAHLVLREGLG